VGKCEQNKPRYPLGSDLYLAKCNLGWVQIKPMLVRGGQGIMHLQGLRWHTCRGFLESRVLGVPAMWGCTVCFLHGTVHLFCLISLPFPPSLVDLVSTGLVSISTDLVSVTGPSGWLLLPELPWIPACPAQGSLLTLEPLTTLGGTIFKLIYWRWV